MLQDRPDREQGARDVIGAAASCFRKPPKGGETLGKKGKVLETSVLLVPVPVPDSSFGACVYVRGITMTFRPQLLRHASHDGSSGAGRTRERERERERERAKKNAGTAEPCGVNGRRPWFH